MPAFIGARIEGAARLRSTLKGAGVELSDFTKLNKDVANIVLPAARAGAPVGPEVNGHIRSTIRAGATRKAAIIRVGTASFPYSQPLHWGWHRRHIRPNPWVSRAAQETEPQWTERYFQGLGQILDKIKGA